MADVLHEVGFQASREDLYTALTTTAGLRSWWSEHSEIGSGVGAQGSVSFYNNMVTFLLQVTELEPASKVVWAVEDGPPDWANTVITWTIFTAETPFGPQTTLHLAHSGFESTGGNFASVNYNWGWYMTSLKFYLEKGEGMPHTDADMPG